MACQVISESVDLEAIFVFLSLNEYPPNINKDRGKKANFRRQSKNFRLRDGELFKLHLDRKGESRRELKVIVDRDERQRILQEVHQGESEGMEVKAPGSHVGQDKTEVTILKTAWWPGIRGDVRAFISGCDICQKRPSRFKGTLDMLGTSNIWQQIGVDICYMPKSKEGFTCVAVAVDFYTKWVEAEPLLVKSPKEVAGFLHSLVIRHGLMDVHVNDEEAFVGQVSTELQCLCGLQLKMTGSSDSQPNKQFKQNHRIIQDLVLKLFSDDGDVGDWPKALPGVLFKFRTCDSSTSKVTPFFLLFRRHPHLPSDGDSKSKGEEEEGSDLKDQYDVCFDAAISETDGESHEQREREEPEQKEEEEEEEQISEEAVEPVRSAVRVSKRKQKAGRRKRQRGARGVCVGDQVVIRTLGGGRRGGGEDGWLGPYFVTKLQEGGTVELQPEGTASHSMTSDPALRPYSKKQRLMARHNE